MANNRTCDVCGKADRGFQTVAVVSALRSIMPQMPHDDICMDCWSRLSGFLEIGWPELSELPGLEEMRGYYEKELERRVAEVEAHRHKLYEELLRRYEELLCRHRAQKEHLDDTLARVSLGDGTHA